MRPLVLGLFLLLGACAKDASPVDITCKHDTSAYTVRWPDGIDRKSEVYACSDGCFQFKSLDGNNSQFKSCEFGPK